MQIGCCTSINHISVLESLGYDFIDLPGAILCDLSKEEFDRVRIRLQNSRLKCMAFHASVPTRIKITGDLANSTVNREYLRKLMNCADQLGVRFVGIGSPNSRAIPACYDRKKADEQMIEFLNTACDYAGENTMVLLEPVNRTETNYVNSVTEAMKIVTQVNHRKIGILFDVYHFLMEKEPLETITPELINLVKYMHIAVPNSRTFPDIEHFQMLKTVVDRAMELGYRGDISVEAVTENFEVDAKEVLAILRKFSK